MNIHTLYSFQSAPSIAELLQEGRLAASWSRYAPSDPFLPAYRWMASQMAEYDIDCLGYAPIWAWHSCSAWKAPPRLLHARNLLSDLELEAGIQVIEFVCPDNWALLSRYAVWNEVLDRFVDDKEKTTIAPALAKQLFDIPNHQLEDYDAIQASLPLLKKEWVKDIRPLKLRPNDFTYDPEEFV